MRDGGFTLEPSAVRSPSAAGRGAGAADWRTGNLSVERMPYGFEVLIWEDGAVFAIIFRLRMVTSDQGASRLGVEDGGRGQTVAGSHTAVSFPAIDWFALFRKKLDSVGSLVAKPDSCSSFRFSSEERCFISSLRSAIFL